MTTPLYILQVEDNADDALLVLEEFRRNGYTPEAERVEDAEALRAALAQRTWDLITLDYTLPHLNGVRALQLIHDADTEVPVIIVSGTMHITQAVTLMREGARDFLMKDELTRLGPVVARELQEAELRRKYRAAQQEHQARETLFDQILQTASDVIVTIDEDEQIVLVNHAVERTLGYRPDELIGQSVMKIMPERYRTQHHQAFTDYLARGERHLNWEKTTFPALHRDGHEVQLEISYGEVRQPGMHLFVGIMRDITDRLNYETQLRKQNRALRLLSEVNQALIHTETEERLLQRCCEIAVDIGGFRMAWVGMKTYDERKTVRPVASAGFGEDYVTTHPFSWSEDTPDGQGPIGRAIRSRKPVYAEDLRETPLFTPWVEAALERGYRSVIVLPLNDNSDTFGTLTLYHEQPYAYTSAELALLTELSDDLAFGITVLRIRAARLTAEQALQRETNFLAAAMDIMPFPIFFVAPDRHTLRSNQQAKEKIGDLSQNHHTGKGSQLLDATTNQVIPWEQWPDGRAARGETVAAEEYIVHTPDGRKLNILCYAAPIREDGKIIAAVVAVQDISVIKEADRAKTQFLAILSHELRTPLTNIIGWAHEAQELPEIIPDALRIILHNAENQRRLLENLLEISRMLYGRFTLRHERIDLRQLALRAVDEVKQISEDGCLHVEDLAAGEQLLVQGDPTRLQEAIITVLDVALEMSHSAECRVEILGTQLRAERCIIIRQAGPSIPDIQIPRVLELFQVTPETVQIGGIGVRLALARAIVEAHGGTLNITKWDQPTGNIFHICLPAID